MSKFNIFTLAPHIIAQLEGVCEERARWLCEARLKPSFNLEMAAAILGPDMSKEFIHEVFSFERPPPRQTKMNIFTANYHHLIEMRGMWMNICVWLYARPVEMRTLMLMPHLRSLNLRSRGKEFSGSFLL